MFALALELLVPAIVEEAYEVFDWVDCCLAVELASVCVELMPYLEFLGFMVMVCMVGLPWFFTALPTGSSAR